MQSANDPMGIENVRIPIQSVRFHHAGPYDHAGMPAVELAVTLDYEQLLNAGAEIHPSNMSDADLPARKGPDIAKELGGRWLVRYLTAKQQQRMAQEPYLQYSGEPDQKIYVTPTPLPPRLAIRVLALPNAAVPRTFRVLIDPSKVRLVLGPRWVRGGTGIEYVLPRGYGPSALVAPRWPLPVA
jgi:hypothetical protein